MSKFKAGDKVKVVKYTDENWYGRTYIGEEYTVSECYDTFVSVVELGSERYGFNPGHLELVKAAPEVKDAGINFKAAYDEEAMTTDLAVGQLTSLLGDAYDEVTISVSYKHICVDWNNMAFVAETAKELEDICKAITLLSGAKIGD